MHIWASGSGAHVDVMGRDCIKDLTNQECVGLIEHR